MSKDISGPAFPTSVKNMSSEDLQGFAGDVIGAGTQSDYKGLSIRQYAAIKAMQGLLANSNGPVQANAMCGWSLCNCTESDVAALSVKLADALLAELEK